MKHTKWPYPIDNSAIMQLATLRPDDSNLFRYELDFARPIDRVRMEAAIRRTARRCPTVAAGIGRDRTSCGLLPREEVALLPDPGLLRTMSPEEAERCAIRIFYRGSTLAVEYFHALTDGKGALVFLKTLAADYLGLRCPEDPEVLDTAEAPKAEELRDDYLTYAGGKGEAPAAGASYQVPGKAAPGALIRASVREYAVSDLRRLAKSWGVTLNGLIAAVMFRAVALVRRDFCESGKTPIRIMSPVDLRRVFPSRTLRNFSYFTLPALTDQEALGDLPAAAKSIGRQLKAQCAPELLRAAITTNARLQQHIPEWMPLSILLPVLLAANKLFGARTSCMSLSNLGLATVPEQMAPHVTGLRLLMTPRVKSPYNCCVISFRDTCTVAFTHLDDKARLAERFFAELDALLQVYVQDLP